jgi:hypothetical protein
MAAAYGFGSVCGLGCGSGGTVGARCRLILFCLETLDTAITRTQSDLLISNRKHLHQNRFLFRCTQQTSTKHRVD